MNIAIALPTILSGIFLLNALMLSLFWRLLLKDLSNTQKVVVLIPPPVEPEEAPININMIMLNILALVIPAISMLLNPAVLADAD